MQVILATLVLVMAGCVFLVFLVVPRLRRHAHRAVAGWAQAHVLRGGR